MSIRSMPLTSGHPYCQITFTGQYFTDSKTSPSFRAAMNSLEDMAKQHIISQAQAWPLFIVFGNPIDFPKMPLRRRPTPDECRAYNNHMWGKNLYHSNDADYASRCRPDIVIPTPTQPLRIPNNRAPTTPVQGWLWYNHQRHELNATDVIFYAHSNSNLVHPQTLFAYTPPGPDPFLIQHNYVSVPLSHKNGQLLKIVDVLDCLRDGYTAAKIPPDQQATLISR